MRRERLGNPAFERLDGTTFGHGLKQPDSWTSERHSTVAIRTRAPKRTAACAALIREQSSGAWGRAGCRRLSRFVPVRQQHDGASPGRPGTFVTVLQCPRECDPQPLSGPADRWFLFGISHSPTPRLSPFCPCAASQAWRDEHGAGSPCMWAVIRIVDAAKGLGLRRVIARRVWVVHTSLALLLVRSSSGSDAVLGSASVRFVQLWLQSARCHSPTCKSLVKAASPVGLGLRCVSIGAKVQSERGCNRHLRLCV